MKKFLKFKTFMYMIIITLALIYYCFKYYQQGVLFFNQNQFVIFVVFMLVTFWIFGYLIWQNSQLQENDVLLKELLQVILENNKEISNDIQNNHYNLVKMNNNTRQLFLEALKKNNVKEE